MTRGLWDRETVALILVACFAPLALIWVWLEGTEAAARFLFALLVSGFWHAVFMLARAQPPSFAGIVSAFAVAMLAPEELGIVRLVLGLSFGAVFGELIFGGWGRNVVNPATVTLSFLGFGFPAAPWPDITLPLAWAAIPAVVFGLVTGVMPALLLISAVASGFLAVLAVPDVAVAWPAAFVILAVLVADPVAGAATAIGRSLNGILFAGLTTMFVVHWESVAPVQAGIAAALLCSLAAPLFDEIAMAFWISRRRARHGRL